MDNVKPAGWGKIFPFLWRFFEKNKVRFIFILTILLLIQIYQFVPAIIVGQIVDFFADYEQGESLDLMIFFIVFIGAGNLLVANIRLITRKRMREIFVEMTYKIKVYGFERLIDFSMKWHDNENTGNKIERLNAGSSFVKKLSQLFVTGGPGIITLGTNIVFTVIAFIFIDALLAILSLVFVTLFLFIHFHYAKKIGRSITERNKVGESASGRFFEGLSNVLTIKSLGAKDTFKSKIYQSEDQSKELELKILQLNIRKRQWYHVVISIAYSTFIGLLVYRVINQQISIGDLLIYWTYFGRLIDSTWDSTDIIDELQEIQMGISRMMPLFETEVDEIRGHEEFPGQFENLELKNISFSYKEKDAEFYLENINLNLNKSERIGIAGRSGSGKSTIVKLLLGLYPLNEGKYLINNKDFYSIQADETNKHFSIVLQESELFNYSLKENITLLKEVDEELLLKSIRIAQIEQLIEKLPEGIETPIGEKGYRVSGGERQRIGIARAIYKNADILIMDEATSNLDSKTEAKVLDALEAELSDKSIITIAHRVSSLKNSDIIHVMEKGRIVETGTFDELVAKPEGKFTELYKIQSMQNK